MNTSYSDLQFCQRSQQSVRITETKIPFLPQRPIYCKTKSPSDFRDTSNCSDIQSIHSAWSYFWASITTQSKPLHSYLHLTFYVSLSLHIQVCPGIRKYVISISRVRDHTSSAASLIRLANCNLFATFRQTEKEGGREVSSRYLRNRLLFNTMFHQ